MPDLGQKHAPFIIEGFLDETRHHMSVVIGEERSAQLGVPADRQDWKRCSMAILVLRTCWQIDEFREITNGIGRVQTHRHSAARYRQSS